MLNSLGYPGDAGEKTNNFREPLASDLLTKRLRQLERAADAAYDRQAPARLLDNRRKYP